MQEDRIVLQPPVADKARLARAALDSAQGSAIRHQTEAVYSARNRVVIDT